MRGGTKNGAGRPRWLFLAAGNSASGAKIKIVTVSDAVVAAVCRRSCHETALLLYTIRHA